MVKRVCFIRGFGALLVMIICGCSAIEVRSPIVIHTRQGGAGTEADNGARQQLPRAEVTPSEVPKLSASPADILVLSDKDLSGASLASLGRISVTSDDKPGFTQEQAVQELKIKAFKRYGSLAQALAHIEYMGKPGFLGTSNNMFRQATAEVFTMSSAAQPDLQRGEPTQGVQATIVPLEHIAIVSSSELFNRNFKILGMVQARDTTPQGMTEEQAVKRLKIEAFRLYGAQARAITNIKMKKEYPIYYYKKPQFSPPPKAPEGYGKATAEVVYWP